MHKPGDASLKVVIVVTTLLLSAGALAIGLGSSPGSIVSDGTPSQPADMTDPAVQAIVKKLDARIDTCASLQENLPKLTELQQQLDLLPDELAKKFNGDSLNSAKDKVGEIKGTIQKLIDLQTECNNAKSTVTSEEIKTVWEAAKKAATELSQLGTITAFGSPTEASLAVDFAKLLVTYNNNGGGVISRSDRMTPMLTRSQVATVIKDPASAQDLFNALKDKNKLISSSDCAGFVAYILTATGALNGYTNTEGLVDAGLEKIKEYTPEAPITADSIKSDLANGTIRPGDIMVVNLKRDYSKVSDTSHAVFVVGTSFDDPAQGLAQVWDQGPVYQSIKERASIIRKGNQKGLVSVVLRPHYK